jgi:tetratricopeptide (TPR) repeat protein
MRKIFLMTMFTLFSSLLFAQNKTAADELVHQGVALHDEGKYDQAVAKYDQALLQDKDNFLALTEKAYSLSMLQKYDEAIACCKKVIALNPNSTELGMVYVTYGNALDAQNKGDESIRIYDEGLKKNPNFYQLYFNKGVTLIGLTKYDDAILAFQKAVTIKPTHASSHNALSTLLAAQKKTIPSLLASCRFLILEPKGTRASRNLDNIKQATMGGVEKTGKNSFSINLDPSLLGDTTANGKPKENSFANTELIMSFSAAIFSDKKIAKSNAAQKLNLYMTTLCGSLKEEQSKSSGFYWTYYVPFFLEMQEKEYLETFCYIAYASSDEKGIAKWINEHSAEVNQFYKWAEAYKWPS